jgi:type III secretion protein J
MVPESRSPAPPRRPPRRRRRPASPRGELLLLLALLALAGCGREEVVHGLDEPAANEVLVALDEGGIAAEKRREDGTEERWAVAVPAGAAAPAQRLLAERALPRARAAGFGEVFGKGSMVPTATEERALYLHALAGELARSVEAIDGVVAARVHLALPPHEPLRTTPAPPARAAVLVKVRPGARGRVEPLAPGIQSLVAGAVAGLDASAVSVVLADGTGAGAARGAAPRSPRAGLLAAAALAALVAAVIGAWPSRARLLAVVARRTP